MSHRSILRAPRKRRAAAAVAVAGLALTAAAPAVATSPAAGSTAPATPPSAPPDTTTLEPRPVYDDGRYIVLLEQTPTAAYDGGVAGYAATEPEDGETFEAGTRAAQRYDELLERRQDRVQDRSEVGQAQVSTEFTTVTNGFTAELTGEEATALSKDPAVLSVTADELLQPTTNRSPRFLGLRAPDGLWKQLGKRGTDGAGSGTVIGVVDSGIWPESRSFRAFNRGDSRDATADELGYTGICDRGADRSFARACNNKLIGGRYYVEGFGADNIAASEYLSPRDGDGHGSHTGSTAAGRFVDNPKSEGQRYDYASGMAPGARLAAYKVCWEAAPGASAGCFTSDSVEAINDAVADGVDAINFSIGGGSESEYTDPTEIAFLNAAAANVFVAASAGNSGPGASTFDHPSPWITTVAASTHKILESTVELGNGERFIGASLTAGLPQTPAVLAVDSAADGVDPDDAQLCFPDSLDPATVEGTIVVCDRGVNDRVEKSLVVEEAGGAGMILVNPPGVSGVNADNHFVPSVHLETPAYDPVYDYVEGNPDATAAILAGENAGSDTQVPEVIDFSSRGPSVAAEGDIIKPDISAPGVDVLAAVAPPTNYGRSYDFYSGTSMSSPHIAGLSLLLQEQYPDWTPMQIKSAMMTTSYDHATTTSAFEQGAGFVDPREFSNPGLVYSADLDDWAGFLLGQGTDIGHPGARPVEATQLNQASIAIGELAGTETVRRTVTNVTDRTLSFRPQVTGMDGIDVQVRPQQLIMAPGSRASFDVTFTHAGAEFGEYAQGHLTWRAGGIEARSPLVVNPVSVSAPAEVAGAGTEGSLTYDITAGAAGPLDLTVNGLSRGVVEEGSLPPGEVVLSPAGNASTDVYRFQVDEDTSLARFDLDAADDADDFDLYLVNEAFDTIVASSATGAADERVDLLDPEPGNYHVLVGAFATSDGEPGDYTLTNHAVGTGPAGNMTVDPESIAAELGETYPVTLDWSGLDPAPYLGWVGYSGSEQPTIVSIDGAGGSARAGR